MVLWNPYGGCNPTQKFSVIKNSRIFRLTQRTTMPHAEIDVSCDTELIFRIPYSSAFSYVPIHLFTSAAFQAGALGEVQIFPYASLNAVAGALSCDYTMYFSMENVELFSAAIPQSGRFSASRRGKNVQRVEQESANMGPLSSALATVSKSAGLLQEIPLISTYASTTAWFADRLAKTASIFGFSKPVNLEHPQRVTRNMLHYMASTDGPDQSQPLALSYKNEIGLMPGAGPTDLDEMSFNYIASIPAWIQTLGWNAAQPGGTLIASLPVTPVYGSHGYNTNGITVLTDAPCSWVSRFFKYWRGSIVYKFKIVRTEFHSGRLAFAFNPVFQDSNGVVTPAYNDTNYIQREIVDIREHTEVTFTVPYISPTPYTLCLPSHPDGGIGSLSIFVVDTLLAPSTVPSAISILVEIAAGPDMEWAVPVLNDLNTVVNLVPQSANFRWGDDSACNILNKTIGTARVTEDQDASALYCIGEKITSFRALLKKPNILTYSGVTPSPDKYFSVVPYFVQMTNLTGVTVTRSEVNADTYAMLAPCFLYSSGGVRVKLLDHGEPVTGAHSIATLYTGRQLIGLNSMLTTSAATFNGATYPSVATGSMPTQVSFSESPQEIQVPTYFNMPLRVNTDCMSNPDYPYRGENGTTTRNFAPDVYIVKNHPDASITFLNRAYRSMSDDGNMSFFLCCMPYTNVGVEN
nr:MAG: polyprotein [Picornavirales sp.]